MLGILVIQPLLPIKVLYKSPQWTYANPGAYKVTVRATANGCTGSLTKNSNQFATPVAKYTFLQKFVISQKFNLQMVQPLKWVTWVILGILAMVEFLTLLILFMSLLMQQAKALK
jgi:hypothetical protein